MYKNTIIRELHNIERRIYDLPYDELSDYLKGVRDVINVINGDEKYLDSHVIMLIDRIINEKRGELK